MKYGWAPLVMFMGGALLNGCDRPTREEISATIANNERYYPLIYDYVGEHGVVPPNLSILSNSSAAVNIDPFNRKLRRKGTIMIGMGENVVVEGGPLRYYILSRSEALIVSNGPDLDEDITSSTLSQFVQLAYDPTNGTFSDGDIVKPYP